ncbi:efflux RND transporter periplasmic adaptor subunit [Sphingomonas sp. RP10(2022)]|uniref:Efflux RND transporter periplasmic adaptor subunit n=1 Tax=Sphingomonas liriopis TaxID=2949094 RepID=A0A9X2KRR3_9SPHN|nr:efflux RND transporter periplasmic adaptor subunit [Sphingomonas liriopis]MCP3736285.1 efflux RND transporter periplasmic adaptor subunit [Sphingomonas liriopis]
MSSIAITRPRLLGAAALLAVVAGGAGFGIARLGTAPAADDAVSPTAQKKILYWYDPMIPAERHDGPGLSSMGMKLIPRYADEGGGGSAAPGVVIDAAGLQRLGARIVAAERGSLSNTAAATGSIEFNDRNVAIVQARSGGFVQRVYMRAPGDVVPAGAPLADILVPEWAGAQAEYLAVRRTGDAALARAARQRLLLLGMPAGLVASAERSGRTKGVTTISTPVGGVIKTLGVRQGMTVSQGQTLAEVNGLDTVWLNAAVPEAIAGKLRIGTPVTATLAAFPGESFRGRIAAILPQADAASRTLTIRVELSNRGGRLRPGMFASVALDQGSRDALLVPSEAVIRTGRRTLVMLAGPGGRFRPAEVRIGAEGGGKTEIVAGLSEGEKVVASGQFLIDSEASLAGLDARPIGGAAPPTAKPAPKPAAPIYETVGSIEAIDRSGVTLSHQPVPAIGWPAMTMTFRVADPALVRGYRKGDRVRFGFDQPAEGPTLRRMTREAGR